MAKEREPMHYRSIVFLATVLAGCASTNETGVAPPSSEDSAGPEVNQEEGQETLRREIGIWYAHLDVQWHEQSGNKQAMFKGEETTSWVFDDGFLESSTNIANGRLVKVTTARGSAGNVPYILTACESLRRSGSQFKGYFEVRITNADTHALVARDLWKYIASSKRATPDRREFKCEEAQGATWDYSHYWENNDRHLSLTKPLPLDQIMTITATYTPPPP
jgi:hypothetical protein